MTTHEEPMGSIDISPAAVATIVNNAVHQCYGVVGMANKNLVNGIAHTLSRDNRRGIEISFDGGQIVIDVYVILQYGTPIRAVAESIQNTVTFHVDQALGSRGNLGETSVKAVNVYVQGLRRNDAGS